METQKDVSNSDEETKGPDLHSEEQDLPEEEKEFKKGGDLAQTGEIEGQSLPGDKWDQGNELLDIRDQNLDFDQDQLSEKAEPFKRLAKKKKPPDLLETQEYRRSERQKKPPDRLEYN